MQDCEKCSKVDLIEGIVNHLDNDVDDLKEDVRHIQTELQGWFIKLETVVHELQVSNVKIDSRLDLLETLSLDMKSEARESKKFRNKMILTIVGGAVSFVVFVIQQVFVN
jgi:hypothetical protein